jgi:hypothetical protein
MRVRRDIEAALARARSPGERVAFLGALLASESKLGDRLHVVGGSAISVYTEGAYVSKDIDVVGPVRRISPVLRRWGFRQVDRKDRRYWARDDLGILIDIIDRADYVGLAEGTRLEQTAYGPVRISAVEDLIVRRLVFAKRGRNRELLDQATLLWVRFGKELDQEYLDYHVRFEDVLDTFSEMKRRASRASGGKG